jgi:type II secretion system protein N
MTPRLRRILRAVGFGAFYVFALIIFAYVTFPYERLRDRIVQEFNQRQTGPDPMRLEIDELDAYWLSGVEAEGIRLIPSPKPAPPSAALPGAETTAPPKPRVMNIDSAHVRVGILPLLIGSTRLTFGADAFGGNISGNTSESDGARHLEIELENLSLAEAPVLADTVGLPMTGTMNGELELTLPESKLAKAEGTVKLKIEGLSVGDGKAKIRDTIAVPKVEAGTLELDGQAAAGTLKISKFEATGPHLEFVSEGSIRLRDPATSSLLNLTARFRLSDKYKNQNDTTRGIFGAPGSSSGLFDLDPKNRRAKRPDGFYAWRVSGALSNPSYTPNPGGTTAAKTGRTTTSTAPAE